MLSFIDKDEIKKLLHHAISRALKSTEDSRVGEASVLTNQDGSEPPLPEIPQVQLVPRSDGSGKSTGVVFIIPPEMAPVVTVYTPSIYHSSLDVSDVLLGGIEQQTTASA
ncbi:hypothetical protein CGRA01v4_12358 [Colletotrichum graminicola]|uniref:Uncharacterized protein n=1 Tax=Colletotrichum graminicola (strain M1.001 / M2 / FGSC 10212) TaxID=645133 RepID=E3QSG8_COLGM|nr:uncharacterized protein GLRG_08939 [Colletotrichum graminicola M1.001]EFQ33795.1 hypothetical protein GLRG_08939 [Colletotrichum graminicola M1.001]WDK21069.1 hypothetical protein CGRA01v4_12358 [Colletotrichum graminicola]